MGVRANASDYPIYWQSDIHPVDWHPLDTVLNDRPSGDVAVPSVFELLTSTTRVRAWEQASFSPYGPPGSTSTYDISFSPNNLIIIPSAPNFTVFQRLSYSSLQGFSPTRSRHAVQRLRYRLSVTNATPVNISNNISIPLSLDNIKLGDHFNMLAVSQFAGQNVPPLQRWLVTGVGFLEADNTWAIDVVVDYIPVPTIINGARNWRLERHITATTPIETKSIVIPIHGSNTFGVPFASPDFVGGYSANTNTTNISASSEANLDYTLDVEIDNGTETEVPIDFCVEEHGGEWVFSGNEITWNCISEEHTEAWPDYETAELRQMTPGNLAQHRGRLYSKYGVVVNTALDYGVLYRLEIAMPEGVLRPRVIFNGNLTQSPATFTAAEQTVAMGPSEVLNLYYRCDREEESFIKIIGPRDEAGSAVVRLFRVEPIFTVLYPKHGQDLSYPDRPSKTFDTGNTLDTTHQWVIEESENVAFTPDIVGGASPVTFEMYYDNNLIPPGGVPGLLNLEIDPLTGVINKPNPTVPVNSIPTFGLSIPDTLEPLYVVATDADGVRFQVPPITIRTAKNTADYRNTGYGVNQLKFQEGVAGTSNLPTVNVSGGTYTLASFSGFTGTNPPPAWMSIDPTTGEITGTPPPGSGSNLQRLRVIYAVGGVTHAEIPISYEVTGTPSIGYPPTYWPPIVSDPDYDFITFDRRPMNASMERSFHVASVSTAGTLAQGVAVVAGPTQQSSIGLFSGNGVAKVEDKTGTVIVTAVSTDGLSASTTVKWKVIAHKLSYPAIDPTANTHWVFSFGDAISILPTIVFEDGEPVSDMTYRHQDGNLPPGLAIDTATGEVSGIIIGPARSGTCDFRAFKFGGQTHSANSPVYSWEIV